jgi:hypothetical protein
MNPERSMHHEIGPLTLGFDANMTPEAWQFRARQMLLQALSARKMVAVVGSGVSAGYGLPSWAELAREVAERVLPEAARGEFIAQHFEEKGGGWRTRPGVAELAVYERLTACGDLHEPIRKAIAAHSVATPPAECDTLRPLLVDLRIGRFITTNYDDLIEASACRLIQAQVEHRGPPPTDAPAAATASEPPGYEPFLRLVLDPRDPEALSQFAAGVPGHRRGVFHCHGSVVCRGSLIATEDDYQAHYLGDEPVYRSFREALDLAFLANPLLFVGVGLAEMDVLRPLRRAVAAATSDGKERPWFALMERPAEPAQAHTSCIARYKQLGIKVILYGDGSAGTRSPAERAAALTTELTTLAHEVEHWWESWEKKPRVRIAQFREIPIDPAWTQGSGTPGSGLTVIHHCPVWKPGELGAIDPAAERAIKDKLGSLPSSPEGGRLMYLLGPSGVGKGTIAYRLACGFDLPDPSAYGLRFFASTNYSNEFLSVLEAATRRLRALRGAPAEFDPEMSWPDAILLELGQQRQLRALVVLFGMDRLLEPPRLDPASGGEPDERSSVNQEIGLFFSGLRSALRKAQVDVVLSGTAVPKELGLTADDPSLLRLERGQVEIALRSDIARDRWARLAVGLNRHTYALCVARSLVEASDDPNREVARLAHVVSSTDHLARARQVVAEAIAAVRRVEPRAVDLLYRACLFSSPVSQRALAATVENPQEIERLVRLLGDRRLLLTINPNGASEPPRYVPHTLVRHSVLHSLDGPSAARAATPRYALARYHCDDSEDDPATDRSHRLTQKTVEGLLLALEGADPSQTHDLARATFAALHGRCSAIGATRLADLPPDQAPHCTRYSRNLLRLLRSLDRTAGWVRSRDPTPGGSQSRSEIEDATATFYTEELLWLYNELALGAFVQGWLDDAQAMHRMVRHLSVFAERDRREGFRRAESRIAEAAIRIERGRLAEATDLLARAVRFDDAQVRGRATGLLGMVAHLQGDFHRARKHYDVAIDDARAHGNQRGASIFLRHRADLQRLRGRVGRAKVDLEASLHAAQAGRYPDLVQHARISQVHLAATDGKGVDLAALRAAVVFAGRMGMPRVELDATSVMALTALRAGNLDRAAEHSRRCLALATRLGMGLRVTANLLLLGDVARRRSPDPEAATVIYQSVRRLGRRQAYYRMVQLAEERLEALRPEATLPLEIDRA